MQQMGDETATPQEDSSRCASGAGECPDAAAGLSGRPVGRPLRYQPLGGLLCSAATLPYHARNVTSGLFGRTTATLPYHARNVTSGLVGRPAGRPTASEAARESVMTKRRLILMLTLMLMAALVQCC